MVELDLLTSAARDLGFTLPLPRVALMLEVDGVPIGPELLRTVRAVFNHPEDIVAVRSATRCIVLAHAAPAGSAKVDSDARRLLNLAGERFGLDLRIAVGEPGSSVPQLRDACQDVTDALWLGARVTPDARLLHIIDLRAHQALAGIPRRERERLLGTMVGPGGRQSDWADLRSTVIAWCENGFNLVAAASALHIHRNTLVYRLEKTERLLGRPWRDHRAMLSLYLTGLVDQLEPPRADPADPDQP